VPPARFNYRRHFTLLACAIVVIAIMARLDLFGTAALLPNAAIYGALHAAALCGALISRATLARKSAFMLAASALSMAALYAGLFTLALLSTASLGLGVRACIALGLSSMLGAVVYGLLIRAFWLPDLSPRPIMQISIACSMATLLTLLLENLAGLSSIWVLAAAWWSTLSGGLWLSGRMQSLRRHA
jgi:hypothetical protein